MQLRAVIAPMLIAAVGVFLSLLGVFLVRTKEGATMKDLLHSLGVGTNTAAILIAVCTFGILYALYEGAVRRPIMTTLVFIAIAIFGLFSLSKLPIDLMPDIDTNMIMVMETYPGASAEDIENNVTRPLENTLNSVNYLKHITSQSQENYAMITLEFEYGYERSRLPSFLYSNLSNN